MSNDNSQIPKEINVNLVQPDITEEGISIAQMVHSFNKRKMMVLAVTMIALIVGVIAAFGYYFITKPHSGAASAILSYSYKGIEKGLDPLGRVLDVNRIKSPYVIDQAIQELDLYSISLTVEDVRSNIVIEGILPDDVTQRLLIINEIATKDITVLEKLSEIEYYPTQYQISLERRGQLDKLDKKQMASLLDAILKYYSAYFIEEYSDRYVFETIAEGFDQSQYDYSEVVQILDSQINNMITYCEVKRKASPDFRSPTTQMTFGDIITNLELVKSVDIGRISALVYASNMSRDKERLIKLYEYRITRMEMDKNIAIENAKAANDMAASYQKDVSLVMGGLGESTTLTQGNEIYDAFVEEALSQTKRANSLEEDIKFYQSRLVALGGMGQTVEQTVTENVWNEETQEWVPQTTVVESAVPVTTAPEADADDIKFVEDAIPGILSSLHNWADITNLTVDDYLVLDAFKDATKVVVPAIFKNSLFEYVKTLAIIIAAVTFVGFFLASLAAIWKTAFATEEKTGR